MIFKRLLRKLIPLRWQKAGKDETVSMVLLLRQPHLFRAAELQTAAEKAWDISFAGGEKGKHFVTQSGNVTFLKAGPHLLNFFYYPRPYVDNPKENVSWLPKEEQRQAWVEHLACVGVDYMNQDTDIELGYCVLAKLVAEMLDTNCTGVYIPRENALAPNNGSLYQQLQRMASSRDSGVKTNSITPG